MALAHGHDHERARSRSPRQIAAADTEVDDEEDLRRVRRRFEAPNLAAAMPVDTDTDAMARMARPPESCTEVLQICHEDVMGQIAPQIAEITNRLRDDIDANTYNTAILRDEVRRIKLRLAWLERDSLQAQNELARKQIVARGWPTSGSASDRWLTIRKLCESKGVDPNTVQLATPTQELQERDPNGYPIRALMPMSILTARDIKDRQQLVGEKFCYFWKWVKKEDTAATAAAAAAAQPDPATGQTPQTEKVFTYEEEWTDQQIKLTPGVTQFERRLEAPIQALMNALNRAFGRSWKGKSFKPNWKTLTVVGPSGEFLGRTRYRRKRQANTGNLTTAPAADWECTIQIPTEIYAAVMKNFVQAWDDQMRKQVEWTDAEEHAYDRRPQ